MGIVKRSSRQLWAHEILQVMRVYPKQGPKHVERKDAHGHLLARADAIPLWQLGWVDGEAWWRLVAASGKKTMSAAAAVYSGMAVVLEPSHRRRRSTSDARAHTDTHTNGAAGGHGAEQGWHW